MNANLTAQLKSLKTDTRKKIEAVHQTAMRANARNGVVNGSSGLAAYAPEILSPEDRKAIHRYEEGKQEDDNATTAQLNARQNGKTTYNKDDPDDDPDDDPSAPAAAVAPTAPAVAPAAAPTAAPVAPAVAPVAPAAAPAVAPAIKLDTYEFNQDDAIEIKYNPKIPVRGILRRASPKKNISVKFGGGRRRN